MTIVASREMRFTDIPPNRCDCSRSGRPAWTTPRFRPAPNPVADGGVSASRPSPPSRSIDDRHRRTSAGGNTSVPKPEYPDGDVLPSLRNWRGAECIGQRCHQATSRRSRNRKPEIARLVNLVTGLLCGTGRCHGIVAPGLYDRYSTTGSSGARDDRQADDDDDETPSSERPAPARLPE